MHIYSNLNVFHFCRNVQYHIIIQLLFAVVRFYVFLIFK